MRVLGRALALLAIGCGGSSSSTDSGHATTTTSAGATTAATTAATTLATASSTASSTTTSAGADASTTVVDSATTGGSDGPITCPRTRNELDLPDDSDEPQIRVLYVVPQDGADVSLDVDDTICNSVFAWSQWLFAATEGRRLRLDTAADVLDIGFVRLAATDAEMHGTTAAADIDTGIAYVRERIERELLAMNLLVPHKIYAVYYGGTSEYSCGGGAYPPLIIAQVAAMYLGGEIPGYPPCVDTQWGEPDLVPRYIDYAMLHEIMHTLGLVDALAPNQHSTGHAFDASEPAPERDLLYSPRPGTSDPPWGVYAPGGLVLDFGRDDYFEHGDRDVVDLAASAFLEPSPKRATLPPGW